MILRLTFESVPIAKKRPRISRNLHSMFNPQSKIESDHQLLARSMFNNRKPFAGPLEVEFTFCFPLPKKPTHKHYFHSRPDIDNLVKYYMDMLNTIAWNDDRQIVKLIAEKIYSFNPCTIIKISEIEDGKKKNISDSIDTL